MLYDFINLANRLTQLGYPEPSQSGFRVMRRDLTQEEKAGNIDFKEDGIYLTIDGQEHKGYMYLKFPSVGRFGFPVFHITNCKTILDQRTRGQFDGRYFWHNSNTVTLEDRDNGQIYENANLKLCNNCKRQSLISDYTDTQGFFNLLDTADLESINTEVEVDIFGYTLDWEQISRAYRREKEYTCESCGIRIEEVSDKRFIHVHHKSGNKLNNRKSNLECLCILCHANKDETHEQNFDKKRMQIQVNTFVKKYRERLQQLGNKFI
jgi:hypothetical protein